ncbi:MAG: hypothetical protein AB8C84_03480 [Oligoflexales bacterium]
MKIMLLVISLFCSTVAYNMPCFFEFKPQISVARALLNSLCLKADCFFSEKSQPAMAASCIGCFTDFDSLEIDLSKYLEEPKYRASLSKAQGEVLSFVFASSIRAKMMDVLSDYVEKDSRISPQYLEEYKRGKRSFVKSSSFISNLSKSLGGDSDPWVGVLFKDIPKVLQKSFFLKFFNLASTIELFTDLSSSLNFLIEVNKEQDSFPSLKEQQHLVKCYEVVILDQFSRWLVKDKHQTVERLVNLTKIFEYELQIMMQQYRQMTE